MALTHPWQPPLEFWKRPQVTLLFQLGPGRPPYTEGRRDLEEGGQEQWPRLSSQRSQAQDTAGQYGGGRGLASLIAAHSMWLGTENPAVCQPQSDLPPASLPWAALPKARLVPKADGARVVCQASSPLHTVKFSSFPL